MKAKMKKALPLMATLLLPACLTGCEGSYDATLTVFNWEDYIYEGVDEDGKSIDDEGGVCKRFESYYKEKTGLKVHVDYQTFSTCEEMYDAIKAGQKADLVCPSDYMIQKMANENMLEEFSYDAATNKYSDSLSNWSTYGSPYIKERFAQEKLDNGKSFLSYAVPYFWGTMGITYKMNAKIATDVDSWEFLWDSQYKGDFTLKDSARDSYVAAIFHVYKDEIAALIPGAPDYNQQLSAIFNRCDDETIALVETALKAAKKNSYGVEVDEGKDDIVAGKYNANLCWSGDSVYSMEVAEEEGVILGYSLPKEGSNIWFDGWCLPKDCNKELAEEFVNFVSDPKIAVLSMDAVGYTSSIAGEEIWSMVKEWYESEDGEDVDVCDVSYFFGDTISGSAKIKIDVEERERQFDAQYPTLDEIKKCCVMKDFGSQTEAVEAMWERVKAA